MLALVGVRLLSPKTVRSVAAGEANLLMGALALAAIIWLKSPFHLDVFNLIIND